MNVQAVSFIAPGANVEQLSRMPTETQGTPFVNWLERELDSVNSQIATSEVKLRELAAGQSTNLHQVMIELEKSKTQLQLVMEVRNKVLEAYQDVMRMQV